MCISRSITFQENVVSLFFQVIFGHNSCSGLLLVTLAALSITILSKAVLALEATRFEKSTGNFWVLSGVHLCDRTCFRIHSFQLITSIIHLYQSQLQAPVTKGEYFAMFAVTKTKKSTKTKLCTIDNREITLQ